MFSFLSLFFLLFSCASGPQQPENVTLANAMSSTPDEGALIEKKETEEKAEEKVEEEDDHIYPFLHDESDKVSISIGNTSYGYLINANHLPPKSEYHQILPRQVLRDLAYGTDEIIELTHYVAKELHEKTGRKLWLGNIGKKGGGDISYSVSHNSGRDIDVAFCYQNRKSKPLPPPDLLSLNSKGISEAFNGKYRFDAPCTWQLVKAFFTNPVTQIQYMFISDPLKKMLIKHAKRKKENPKLIELAELMLSQPRGSASHNDHLHIRIYCSKKDVEGGCVNTGRILPGTNLFEDARLRRIDEVVAILKHKEIKQRRKALERLVFLKAQNAIKDISTLLDDPDITVRQSCAVAIGQLGTEEDSPALIKRFEKEKEPSVQRSMLVALRFLGGEKAARFLGKIIAEPAYDHFEAGPFPDDMLTHYTLPVPSEEKNEKQESSQLNKNLEGGINIPRFLGTELDLNIRSYSLRLAAIEQSAHIERKEPVEALISVLSHEDPLYRDRAARALHLLTNRSFRIPWAGSNLKKLEKGQKKWKKWYKHYHKKSRNIWLASGFRSYGYKVQRIDNQFIWEIVRATASADHLSYNAQKSLMRLTGNTPFSLNWTKRDACWYWARWFKKRHKRFNISEIPLAVRRCYR